jgi:hypothetical protein
VERQAKLPADHPVLHLGAPTVGASPSPIAVATRFRPPENRTLGYSMSMPQLLSGTGTGTLDGHFDDFGASAGYRDPTMLATASQMSETADMLRSWASQGSVSTSTATFILSPFFILPSLLPSSLLPC